LPNRFKYFTALFMPNLFTKMIKLSGFLSLGILSAQAAPTPNDTTSTKPKQRCPYLASSVIARVYEKGQFVGIILVERGRAPIGHAIPGGFIRLKETAEASVKRTLLDECGVLKVSNLKQFNVYSNPTRDPRYHAVDTVFTARVDDVKVCAGTDAKHAYVCPIDKIPWDKLAFDHREILRDFLNFEINSNDKILNTEEIATSLKAIEERNQRDQKELLKTKLEPLFLAASVIIEAYEKGVFKGIVLIDRGKEPFGKAIPGGHVEYGETVEYTAKREMKEECHLDVKDLRKFRVYSDPARDPRKRMVDVMHIARIDDTIPVGGDDAAKAAIFPLDKIPWDELAFDHKKVLQDYLDYRDGKLSDVLIPGAHNPYIEIGK